MPSIWGIDPGKATGFAYGWFDDVMPFTLFYAEILDQDEAFVRIRERFEYASPDNVTVAEGFKLKGGQAFTPDLTGVEIIGAIKYLGLPVVWQWRTDKALVKDQVLKDHGLWQTGKMVGHTDGRDANDAIIHILAYLLKKKHQPTLRKYFTHD